MSEKVVVFGGTSTGTRVAELLADMGVPALLCAVAGFVGETAEPRGSLKVAAKRIAKEEIADTLAQSGCELVLDATHPYAAKAVESIRAACENAGIERIRLEPGSADTACVTVVETARQAVELLNRTGEKALLAVGSRDLPEFTRVKNYRDKLFARVQPTPEAVTRCAELGFSGGHIIGMQGPFTSEMNAATLRMLGATCLVTKDYGRASGLFEKIEAVRQTGCKLILIRPNARDEKGMDFKRMSRILANRYGLALGGNRQDKPDEAPAKRQPFPLFVSLDGKRAVIVGAGDLACRRAKTLLKFGAKITVVADEVCPEMRELADAGAIEWVASAFSPECLDIADIVIAAADRRELNRRVSEAARRMRILVNVADSREESTFVFPAVVQNENIVAGVAVTSGDNAAFSGVTPSGVLQKLREKLGGIL